ncbi:hypothetical protein [Lactococcus garvieae]
MKILIIQKKTLYGRKLKKASVVGLTTLLHAKTKIEFEVRSE